MKLVINLPKWFIADTKEFKHFGHPTPMDNVIADGQPLSEILDKMSEEIESLYPEIMSTGGSMDYADALNDVLKIVERYKKEASADE